MGRKELCEGSYLKPFFQSEAWCTTIHEFNLHVNEMSFFIWKMSTKTRFEKEATLRHWLAKDQWESCLACLFINHHCEIILTEARPKGNVLANRNQIFSIRHKGTHHEKFMPSRRMSSILTRYVRANCASNFRRTEYFRNTGN